MNLKSLQRLLNSLFFWLPAGDALEKKRYSVAVWIVLGFLVFYTISQGGDSREISEHNKLTSQFNLVGRYSLGAKHLFETGIGLGIRNESGKDTLNESYNNLFAEMYSALSSDTDKIGLTILMAEFYGKASALEYLDSLEKESELSNWLRQEINFVKLVYSKTSGWQPNSADRQYIKQQYHWLGELLLTQVQSGQDEIRATIYSQSAKTALLMFSMILFFGLIVIVGFLIDIIVFFKVRQKKISMSISQPGPEIMKGRIVLLETVVCFLGLVLLSSYVMRTISGNLGLILYFISFFTIFWPLHRGIDLIELRNILGIIRGQGVYQEIKFGIKAYLGCIPLILIGILLTMFLVKISGEIPEHPIVYQFEEGGFLRLIKWGFIACVFAPVIEELIFRGAFYHYFRQQYSFWISSFVTSLIFAMIHPQGYAAIPVIMTIGISFSLLRELRNSIIAPITAHILNNSVITVFMLFLF